MFDICDAVSMDLEEAITTPLHLSVFTCGTKNQPFSVIAYKPKDKMGNHIEIRTEFNKLIKEIEGALTGYKDRKVFMSYDDKKIYCEKRLSLNNRMKVCTSSY